MKLSGIEGRIKDMGFDCGNSIKYLCLSPSQYNKIETLVDEFINKHDKLVSDKKSSGSITSGPATINGKKDDSISWSMFTGYRGPVQVGGANHHGWYDERLGCTFQRVVKSTNNEEIEANCKWEAEACYSPTGEAGDIQCETKNKIEFDLNDPTKHLEIPKDTNDIPLFSEKTALLKIGIGSLSTIFFTYKAYKEIRKIYEENRRKPVEKNPRIKAKDEKESSSEPALKDGANKPQPKASRWRALGYTAAAIGSGAFSLYSYQDFKA